MDKSYSLVLPKEFFYVLEYRYLVSDKLCMEVVRELGPAIKRINFESAIKNDDFRSPTTRLVLGNDP
jgi:hypothetical protein